MKLKYSALPYMKSLTYISKKRKKQEKAEKNKIFFKKGLTNACEFGIITKSRDAGMAQSVEHVIGNDEVISSILITSSIKSNPIGLLFLILLRI